MNPNTGHLIALLGDEKIRKGYEEVPIELTDEVQRILAGKKETYVNLGDGSPLSQWAADKRRQAQKKKGRKRRKRKLAKRQRL